ncbi:MAG: glycosyltransferase family 1 protein [Spirochaetales bacterium]|nr:MAG: glycosyltransferase family 1 protein [Spirochaetales bacterium]
MRIAFMHYHLRPGGVTTVIKQQVRALKGMCESLVLTGENVLGGMSVEDAPVAVIPGIKYDRMGKPYHSPEKTADLIHEAVTARWPSGCDVLHLHNPLLKKNARFLRILTLLQERGYRLFLQVHDFAEDGRPNAYYEFQEYPENCHYGVINSRDYRVLLAAGLKPEGLHVIGNVVNGLPRTACPGNSSYVLYPVRGIRRKNLGEALLLTAYMPADYTLGITLPPNSRQDLRIYTRWKQFAGTWRLPVEFGCGLENQFGCLVERSAFMITTSIKEGFGFSFLEPWTAGRAVAGRRLDYVCADFEKTGIKFDGMYQELKIPFTMINSRAFARAWAEAYAAYRVKYGLPADFPEAESKAAAIVASGNVDFGNLDEQFQRKVLRQIFEKESAAAELAEYNPGLQNLGRMEREEIEENRNTVEREFSLDRYRARLLSIYDAVMMKHVVHRIDKKTMLEKFMDSAEWSMLDV